ncbi:MAG: hypothetical protein KDC34_16360 [Saprospiraceae bacterium]|nr:hypothetical protein [Saprospiraceae bacterium]
MKNLILITLGVVLASSCHKALSNMDDYFPVVNTLSATIQADGTMLIVGELESEGAAGIEYLGFCCGTMNEPEMLDRQLIAETFDGQYFSAVYSGFDPDSVYNFRSWATNGFGYVYGNVLSADNIIAAPVSPPCSLVLNKCDIGGGQPSANYYTVSAPANNFNTWEIIATTATGPVVKFIFGPELSTGVYTTVGHDSPGQGQVFVSFYSGFITGSLKAGSSVYVNTIESGVYDISVCDAPWDYNSATFYFNSRLKSPF